MQLQSKETNKITIEGRRGRTVLCNCMHAAYPRAEAVSVLRTQGEKLGAGDRWVGVGVRVEPRLVGRHQPCMHARIMVGFFWHRVRRIWKELRN